MEVDEELRLAVQRECFEELKIKADFWADDPIFLTSILTVELTAGHTDVSLWYVLKGNHQTYYDFDSGEFHSIKWFNFDEVPQDKSDPHIERFIKKLQSLL